MESAPKILIVEDDDRTRSLLERYLKEQGFAVVSLPNGRRLDETLAAQPIKMMILDLMLPGEDGISICRRLRGKGEMVPIIILTAKGDEIDRVVGLEIGADDYVPKPFSPRELVARINAVLRRGRSTPVHGAPSVIPQVVQFGRCSLNLSTREFTRADERLVMTTGEFAVLEALARNPHVPLSRDQLMDLSRGKEHGAYDRSMDVQISRVRRLVEEDSSKPRYIQTVWGFGYVFVPDGPDKI
ncbi:two-component system response regulator OmpR [Synoicihabitans lomoniglobus]|uniref:Two-component system response regulator OmpR n=1 Tax=Synoicihabitans lomoniglobus TaxID=2909285 RepID=A0AAF0CN72_9BACT|nr:two-component system response regulator OmpR [Opitutaceae bacterium LMO-M01]WED65133.1 two-component system response regulator OmpR [Opitutaceae bacterium LMO-M01]